MPLFKKSDEAEMCHREAKRYSDPTKKDFDLALALNRFNEAARLRPDNPDYHYRLGRTYLETPRLAVIRRVSVDFELSRSIELSIFELEQAVKCRPEHMEAQLDLCIAYLISGQEDRASATMRNMVLLGIAGHVEPDKVQAETEVLKPRVEEVAYRRLTGAIPWRKTTGDGLQQARMHIGQAIAYRSLGKYKDAQRELEKAGEFATDLPALYEIMCKLGR